MIQPPQGTENTENQIEASSFSVFCGALRWLLSQFQRAQPRFCADRLASIFLDSKANYCVDKG
jgi:hypothetical protein